MQPNLSGIRDPGPIGRPRAALILGAGWSYAAGLPLANGLFDRVEVVLPGAGREHYELVMGAYREWAAEHPHEPSEKFLEAAFAGRVALPQTWQRLALTPNAIALEHVALSDSFRQPLPWSWVVHAVQVRLAQPDPPRGVRFFENESRARYSPQLLRRPGCRAHRELWHELRSTFDLTGVVTTNYDLLAERAMREPQPRGPDRPAFHYAAFDGQVRPVNSPFRRDRARTVTPDGRVPLAKIHGSLNWSIERGKLVIYPDVRPVWRHGGTAAIVPPLPDKQIPSWLRATWNVARKTLFEAEVWIVVGYSLPPYDRAVQRLFEAGARGGALRRIEIADPSWPRVAERFAACAPSVAVVGRPPLPVAGDLTADVA